MGTAARTGGRPFGPAPTGGVPSYTRHEVSVAAEASPAVMRIVAALRDREDELVDKGRGDAEIPAYTRIDDPALADMGTRPPAQRRRCAAWPGRARSQPRSCSSSGPWRPDAWDESRSGTSCTPWLYNEVFWEAILETVTDDESRAAALSVVSIVIRYINVAATYASEAYLEAESLLQAQGERLRRDLLEDLLDGRPPAPGQSSAQRARPGSSRRSHASSWWREPFEAPRTSTGCGRRPPRSHALAVPRCSRSRWCDRTRSWSSGRRREWMSRTSRPPSQRSRPDLRSRGSVSRSA